MTTTYRYSQREIIAEKWFSGAVLLLVPIPCLVAGLSLARDGHWHAAWVFLGLSILLELLVSIERALVVRAVEVFRVEAWPGHVRLSWPGDCLETDTADVVSAEAVRVFPGRSPSIRLGLSDGRAVRLPTLKAAEELILHLEKEGVSVEDRSHPPFAFLAAAALVAAGLGSWSLLGAHPALSMIALAAALPVMGAGAPLKRSLGPSIGNIEKALNAGFAVAAMALAVGVAVLVPAGSLFTREGYLPPHGARRSRVIFAMASKQGPEALPRLIRLTGAEDPRDRRDGIIALAGFKGPSVIEALREAVSDKDSGVRRAAAGTLGCIEDPSRETLLLTMIASDPDMTVVREANSSLERSSGFTFRAGSPAVPLTEGDRNLAVAFWTHALFPGLTGEGDPED